LPFRDPAAILASIVTHNGGERPLFTPQQLFDEFGSSADVLAYLGFV
jgi:hypothetical protein